MDRFSIGKVDAVFIPWIVQSGIGSSKFHRRRITLGITGPPRLMLHLKTRDRRLHVHAMVICCLLATVGVRDVLCARRASLPTVL
jgi:hypothetical protein